MAKKTLDQQVQEIIEAEPQAPAVAGVCGHINKHFVNIEGEPEDLACDLPAGHAGNHEADYKCLRQPNGTIQDARLEKISVSGKVYVVKTERGDWSDGAATPAENIQPDLNQLAYIRTHKAEMILAENLVRK